MKMLSMQLASSVRRRACLPDNRMSWRRSSRRVRTGEPKASCAGGGSISGRVIAERFGVDYHQRDVGKLLNLKLGFCHHPRPRHPAQDERIVETCKNVWPAPSARGFVEIGG